MTPFVILTAMLAGSEPWPEFRANAGHATGNPPVTWSESDNVRWKTPIPGRGWSSPVVWGEQIWLTTAPEDGKQLFAIAVDRRSGKIVHDVKVFDNPNPEFCHPTNSYASCTPAVEAGRVYVHFGSAGTACLDTATGRKLWERRDLKCDHFRAPGSSPILVGDKFIVNFDGIDVQYVVALNKHTGETVWKTDRAIDFGNIDGDFKKAYATPIVTSVNGQSVIVSPAASYTIAYEVETGREVWRVKHGGMNAAARPTPAAGLLVLTTGDGGDKMLAVKPNGRGDVTATHVAWRANRHIPKRATPLAVGDLLFLAADDGFVSCLEAKTGKEVWAERVGGVYWASPVLAAGRIYCAAQTGEMPVIAAGREFKVLAKNKLAEGCNATPAVCGDDLIIRTKSHLYAVAAK